MAKKTDREKLNKLVDKREKLRKKKKNLKGPLKKIRTKRLKKKEKKIQKKINLNPEAQRDLKTPLAKTPKLKTMPKQHLMRMDKISYKNKKGTVNIRKWGKGNE
jgi:hypothetical protein